MSVHNRRRNSRREKKILQIEIEQADALFERRGQVMAPEIARRDIEVGMKVVNRIHAETVRGEAGAFNVPLPRHQPQFR